MTPEALVGSSASLAYIFQLPNIIQAGAQQGMVLMDMSLLSLVQKGLVTREEALKIAEAPGKIK